MRLFLQGSLLLAISLPAAIAQGTATLTIDTAKPVARRKPHPLRHHDRRDQLFLRWRPLRRTRQQPHLPDQPRPQPRTLDPHPERQLPRQHRDRQDHRPQRRHSAQPQIHRHRRRPDSPKQASTTPDSGAWPSVPRRPTTARSTPKPDTPHSAASPSASSTTTPAPSPPPPPSPPRHLLAAIRIHPQDRRP